MKASLFCILFGCSIAIASAQYCVPTYTEGTTDNDYIDGIELNAISNLGNGAGDGSGYTDYTDLSTNLYLGTTYSIHIVNTPDYGEGYRAWIDYNQDGTFSDDEQLFEAVSVEAGDEVTLPFTVPLGALVGETRLRVRCAYNTVDFDACTLETYGEAEDYTIIVLGLTDDVGVFAIEPISNDCDLSASETIQVQIKNYGLNEVADIIIKYQINGGTPIAETFAGPLSEGAVADFTFSTTADFSLDGTYNITSWTEFASDEYNGNDTTNSFTVNTELGLTTGFPATLCYAGGTVFPFGAPPGGNWSGPAIIDSETGEMDPLLVGGVGSETIVTYSYVPTDDYAVFEIPFIKKPLFDPVDLGLGDDDFVDNVDLGFDFEFFGNVYNEIFISSNGLIGFSEANDSYNVEALPDNTNPDNIIAFCWTDLNPSAGGDIYYEMQGSAPYRKFIVEYEDVPHYLSDATVSGQIVLYETYNMIDIISIDIQTDGGLAAQGIENINGSIAFVGSEAYNNTAFELSNESWRYYATTCVGSVTDTITFIDAPVVSIADSSACIGTTITLDAGTGAEYYIWNTADTTQTIEVTTSGTYTVTYFSNETCFVSDSAVITIYPLPAIDLGDDGSICEGTYLDAANPGSEYLWSTGATTQTVYIETSGTYSVEVINTNGCFNSDAITVEITPLPIADFSVEPFGLSALFTSLSTDAATWFWDFGDGATSTIENPTHTYLTAGNYNVTLVITNACGADITSEQVEASTELNAATLENKIEFYPNPTNETFNVKMPESILNQQPIINIYDITGKIQYSTVMINSTVQSINISYLAAGTYMVVITTNEMVINKPIVKL